MIGGVLKFIPIFDREIEKTYQPNLVGSLDSLPHFDDQYPLIELPMRIPKDMIQTQSPVESIYGCLYMFRTLTLVWTKLGAFSEPRLRAKRPHISRRASPLHRTSHGDKNKFIKRPHKKENQEFHIKMSFEPKTKVELDPPKDDIISLDYLSKCDGE